jgi:hypothetical protein
MSITIMRSIITRLQETSANVKLCIENINIILCKSQMNLKKHGTMEETST